MCKKSIYIYIYIYLYIYICIFKYVYIYICIYIYMCKEKFRMGNRTETLGQTGKWLEMNWGTFFPVGVTMGASSFWSSCRFWAGSTFWEPSCSGANWLRGFGCKSSAADPAEPKAWFWAFSRSRIFESASCNCWANSSGEGELEGAASGAACGFTCGARAGKTSGGQIQGALNGNPKWGPTIPFTLVSW